MHKITSFLWTVLKAILLIVVEIAFLLLMDRWLNGFDLGVNKIAILLFIVVVLFLNFTLRPFLLRLILRFNFFVFAVLIFAINSLIFVIAALPFAQIQLTFGAGIVLALCFSIFDLVASSFFRIQRREKDYLRIIKKNADTHFPNTDKTGFLYLEIDGLGHRIFQEALKKRYMPNLERLLETSHTLVDWECDLSSQTSASQAGILLGNNKDIPAFRWYDRELKRLVTSSNSKDVVALEAKLSNNDGLLVKNGVSVFNLFSGDATISTFTLSKLKTSMKENWDNKSLYYYYVNVYSLPRSIVGFFIELLAEFANRIYQRFSHTVPRLHRDFKYALIRGGMNVFARDVNYNAVIGKIFAGAESIYATYSGYDEVAHHSGIETLDAMITLQKIDKKFEEIFEAMEYSSKHYEIFILSDHGQTQGQTFKQLRGEGLDERVQQLLEKQTDVVGFTEYAEDTANMNQFLSSITKADKNSFLKGIKEREIDNKLKSELNKSLEDKVAVLASGNLGLIYFTFAEKRMNYESIEKLYPGFLKKLVREEGVGFIMVDSKEGPVAISKHGKKNLKTGKVKDKNPLKNFGLNAEQHLLRTHSFTNCPDIIVNSSFDKKTMEGHAFEELIGFHGGLGGDQAQPFILYPTKYKKHFKSKIIGAENVHHTLKSVMHSEQ